MNYEEKSDFEINKAVALTYLRHKYPLAKSIEYDNSQRCFWVESAGFSSYLIPDYCNNPNDAWPIILENRIGIEPKPINDKTNDTEYTAFVLFTDRHCQKVMSVGPNLLRSAMIVFLMMKGEL